MSHLDFITNESDVAPTMGAGALDINYKKKMYRSVVFIQTNSGKGTGSIVWFQSRPMLLTCNHVIPTAEIAKQCTVYFDWQNSANPGTAVEGEILFDLSGSFITSPPKKLDFCLIPLNKIPAIPGDKKEDFLALDGCLHLESHALKPEDQVYLVHYPKIDDEFAWRESPYRVLFLNGFLIGHLAETHGGSSGCPVLKEVERKWVLVGLHKGAMPKELMGIKVTRESNFAISVEEIHKFCTTPEAEYTLPAIDAPKLIKAMQKDLPRNEALKEAHETLKSSFTEPIKPKKPGKVDKFFNLSLIERPPHLYRKKKDVQEFLEATACGIDQYSREQKNFPYDTILTCTMSDSGKRVVIVGSPGSGKSSLARKLHRDLYSGHLPNEYQLVLFAELKYFRLYLKQFNKKASLLTLLDYHSCLPRADNLNLCSMIKEDAGRNVAVILDGFDEISDDKHLSSWVFQLFKLHNMQDQRMMYCDMFITTRPLQLAELTDSEAAVSLVEVLGFFSSDIEQYIKAYFKHAPDRADEVIHELHSLPLVQGLCSNPRVLKITCTVFQHLNKELPDNLSGMFLWYLRYQLETYLMHRADPPVKKRIRNLFSVPQDLFPGFYALCRLAYQCCLDQQLLLEEDELEEVDILKYVDTQGSLYNLLFAESVPSSDSPIPCVLYQSDHKTVTEALAAVHIAVLLPAEQQQIWEEQFTVPHMALVWMMYCGLTGLKSVDLRRLSSLSVSKRGREVIKGAVGWALEDEDMLLMVSLHEAKLSIKEAKCVLPAVLKNTITASITSRYDAMVVGNAITHHPNLQTVDLRLVEDMSEIDLQPLNAKNVKSVELWCHSVAQMQAVLPKDVKEVQLHLQDQTESYTSLQREELADPLRAYKCLHSLNLAVDVNLELNSLFNSLSSRLTEFKLEYTQDFGHPLYVSVESLRNLLVHCEKCSLRLPLTPHQLSAVLVGLRMANKLKELHLYIKAVHSKVSPNQFLISSAEVEELVATHPQLVKVKVGSDKGHSCDLLLAVAKGVLQNKNITHLGLGEYESPAVLPLLRSPSADHITSVRARVDFSTSLRPDDGEWIDLLLGGAMARATCDLTLWKFSTASLEALLSRVHTVPTLKDLSLNIQEWRWIDLTLVEEPVVKAAFRVGQPLKRLKITEWREDDQTPVDAPGVEAAFRVCQLKRLKIELQCDPSSQRLYPLYGAVLCGIAANTAQVDTCIYGKRSLFDVDELTGQLPQQTLERFEVVKTSRWAFIISRDAACPSVPAPTPDPLLKMSQAVNLTPGNVLTDQDPPTKPVTPPPDQAPLSEPPSGSTQPGSEDA